MRSLFFVIALSFAAFHDARADTFRISAPEFPEAEAVTRLLAEVYGQLGHDIERVVRPAKRSIVEVNKGISDAEMARVAGAETEYPNVVRVGEPILALSFSAVINSESKLWLGSWEEVSNHSIAYPRGYRILDVRTKDMDAIVAKDPAAVARMVKGGRIDVGVLITSHAHDLAEEIGGLTVLEPPMEVVTLYHYLHVNHRRLVPEMEKILIDLNDSGRAKEIVDGTN